MTSTLPTSFPAVAHRGLEPLHAMIYFAPEADEEYQKVGLRPGRMPYFASRSAPMGPVTAGVTAATFYSFNPDLIAKYIPRAWTLATVQDVLAARLALADRRLRVLLGEDGVASPEVAEAAGLARAATADLSVDGRPLYAGHAGLDWPDEPHLVLWHAITLLREFRGDGHLAALIGTGLNGIEALVTHVAGGTGFVEGAAKATRGWSEDQWSSTVEALTGRGLLGPDGLTEAGVALRAEVEAATDAADTTAWRTLGPERSARLVELGKALSRTAVKAGAFPPGVFASPRAPR